MPVLLRRWGHASCRAPAERLHPEWAGSQPQGRWSASHSPPGGMGSPHLEQTAWPVATSGASIFLAALCLALYSLV